VIDPSSPRGHLPEVLALTLIFSIAIASVSYALVESPCREALRRWEKREKKLPPGEGRVSPPQEDAIAP
jgi:peptidoglycan/LPS O-acetylase OafA/YrhL